MTTTFRKKPVIIEAFQMTEERRVNTEEWPLWLLDAWQLERETVGAVYPTEKGAAGGTTISNMKACAAQLLGNAPESVQNGTADDENTI